MKLKSKIIAMISGLTLAFTGIVSSYAYFTVEKTAPQNKISTGKFPKAKVKIYSSVGPIYNNAFYNQSNTKTKNYDDWLDLASQYIANDLLGKDLGSIGDGKGRFESIPKNSLLNVKSTISSLGVGNYSWQGSKENAENEHGNMIHHVVAIFNEATSKEEAGRKLNYKSEKVSIERYDNFKGESGKIYKMRSKENISLNGKEYRIKTYNWDGIKFVLDSVNGNPSEEADLIVFDMGATGYYTNGKDQADLYKLNNILIGQESIFDDGQNNIFDNNNILYHLANQMKGFDIKARLLSMESKVSFKYHSESNYTVSDNYIVNITGSKAEVPIEDVILPENGDINNENNNSEKPNIDDSNTANGNENQDNDTSDGNNQKSVKNETDKPSLDNINSNNQENSNENNSLDNTEKPKDNLNQDNISK